MYFSKDERIELNLNDLYYTFSDLMDYADDLAEKLNDAIDIIEKINDTVDEATTTAPSMEEFGIRWEDIRKIIDFMDTYGTVSKYNTKIYKSEKVALNMHKAIQKKILNGND